jgi:prepilin-type N-terminal cleavage/methylation domain-containing protein
MRVDTPSRRRGFALFELLVALILAGLLATAVTRISLRIVRHHRWLSERVELDSNLRAAMAFLRWELWPLAAAGTGGSDIADAQESSIRYRSMRGLYVVCAPPEVVPPRLVLRPVGPDFEVLEPDRDSLLLFVESNLAVSPGVEWLRAGIAAVERQATCADGARGLAVTPSSIGRSQFDRVQTGSPVRGFDMRWLLLYLDARGDGWLGERRWKRTTGWSRSQPVAGPLATRGLRFAYRHRTGRPAERPSEVHRIDIELGGAARQAPGASLREGPGVLWITASVALRNNPR